MPYSVVLLEILYVCLWRFKSAISTKKLVECDKKVAKTKMHPRQRHGSVFTLLFGWVVGYEAGGKLVVGPGTQRQAATCLECVVHRAVIVGIEELLEPLQELKVVLEAALY